MTQTIIWTVAILTVLGLLLALILFWVARRFRVEEDPRIDEVEKAMPGANCGGCGFAGCRAFADAAVKAPNLDNHYCPVGGDEVMQKVASILGLTVEKKAPQVAVVRCNGSCTARPRTNECDGVRSCRVKAALYSGDTACSYGCVGCGDCVGGACAKACPKHIIELRNKGPRGMREFVSCVNKDKGPVARKACANACIGCGLCARTCQHGAVTVTDNVSYIDFTKCKLCRECEAVCPSGAIHGVNFPKELDKEAVKKRIADRKAKAAAEAKKEVPNG